MWKPKAGAQGASIEPMSIEAINYVWKKSDQKGSTLLLALAIADFCNDDWCAWPSVDTLAGKTRLSRRTVQYTIDVLVKAGELIVHENQGRNGTNLYQVVRKGVQSLHPCNPASPDCTQSVRNRQKDIRKAALGLVEEFSSQIYDAYPLHVGKPAALKAIKRQIQLSGGPEGAMKLLEKTQAFAAVRAGDLDFCPHPSTWFNQQRYNDDPKTWTRNNGTHKRPPAPSNRNTGTANEGKSAQYAAIGKVR